MDADAGASGAERTPLSRRLARIGIWVGGVTLAIFLLDLLGVPVGDWIDDLLDKLGEVPRWAIFVGILLQSAQTALAALAWFGILRAALPRGGVTYRIVLASYATAVALNSFLPANIGTWVMLLMFTTLFVGATFTMMLSGIFVQKIPFTVLNVSLYLYLFLSVAGSFSIKLGFLADHTGLLVMIAIGAIVLLVLLGRIFWERLVGLRAQAMEGAAILGAPRRFLLDVALPSLGSYAARLGIVAVFLAAYGIPATFHNVASVTASNSISNSVSATPGGVGVTQAMNSAALADSTNAATATAYSISQQVVTSAWNVVLAVVLVSWVFGWSGGKELVESSYEDAKVKSRELKDKRRADKGKGAHSRVIVRWARAVTGRRGRWVVLAAWLAIGLAGAVGHDKLGAVTAAGQSSFLPANAESTRAIEALETGGGNGGGGAGEEVPTVIVFERNGGLTDADLKAIGRIGDRLNEMRIVGATPIVDPFSADASRSLGEVAKIAKGIGPISRDGEAALVVLALNAGDRGAITHGVAKIRAFLAGHRRPGLNAYVTGPGGIAADLERVAEEASETLLIATLGLVLVLLLAVYRAPLLAAMPLLVVGAAYLVATGISYLLIEAGWITVNSEGTMLLLVLIFGAGTDYSLLLVHRYREELDRGRHPAKALPTALAESVPAIAASGGTVIAAMLVLLVANLQSTRWLGPILAIGIATMLAAAFTLLPALLSLLGERAFWPRAGAGERQPHSAWPRVAALVRRRSRAIVLLVFAGLLVLTLGNLSNHGTIGFGQGETKPTNSSRGTAVLNEHFPPGLSSPLAAVVPSGKVNPVAKEMEHLAEVQLVLPVPATGSGVERSVVVLVLHGNPYSGEAAEDVEAIRERLHEVAPDGLLGGIPAENYDIEQTNARDTRLIVPLVLIVVALILAAVLRALVAPGFLIVTVVLSFAATLGLCTFAFSHLSSEGIAFNLVLMAFIFLVALGVDYNIFLMTRAREEAATRGTREGTMVALVNTGGVVTGAGLILAGTFATLTLLPLEELVQIGATVAIGVLLDTFVVRALLIPAISYRLGERTWWPARVAPPESGPAAENPVDLL